MPNWGSTPDEGDRESVQICRILEQDSGQPVTLEGLFYSLIVRLHKYSLGRDNFANSIHWQRGLLLDDQYNGQALLECVGSDVRITVRAAYPQHFLSVLTADVKSLVAEGWPGVRCEVMVPCIRPCGMNQPGRGLFAVEKLISSKRQGLPKFPCPFSGCEQLQDIDCLLNAPVATTEKTIDGLPMTIVEETLSIVREELRSKDERDMKRFHALNSDVRRLMSQVDEQFEMQMQTLTDEAREGPRLFTFEPVKLGFWDRPTWVEERFRLTLWCEHSRVPLPALNGVEDKRGVYELTLSRDWVKESSPYLKTVTRTLSLILPLSSSATGLLSNDDSYKQIAEELKQGQKLVDSFSSGGEASTDRRMHGPILRQIHSMLRQEDPSFGGLVRVQNKRREFLWVHPQFVEEY